MTNLLSTCIFLFWGSNIAFSQVLRVQNVVFSAQVWKSVVSQAETNEMCQSITASPKSDHDGFVMIDKSNAHDDLFKKYYKIVLPLSHLSQSKLNAFEITLLSPPERENMYKTSVIQAFEANVQKPIGPMVNGKDHTLNCGNAMFVDELEEPQDRSCVSQFRKTKELLLDLIKNYHTEDLAPHLIQLKNLWNEYKQLPLGSQEDLWSKNLIQNDYAHFVVFHRSDLNRSEKQRINILHCAFRFIHLIHDNVIQPQQSAKSSLGFDWVKNFVESK